MSKPRCDSINLPNTLIAHGWNFSEKLNDNRKKTETHQLPRVRCTVN